MVSTVSVGTFVLAIAAFVMGASAIYRPKKFGEWAFKHYPEYTETGPIMARVLQVIGVGLVLDSIVMLFFTVFFI